LDPVKKRRQSAIKRMNESKWGFKTVDVYNKVKSEREKLKEKPKRERIKHSATSGTTENLEYFELDVAGDDNIVPI